MHLQNELMSHWRQSSIGELCQEGLVELQTGPFGSQLHAHDYVPQGIPVVPTEALGGRRIDHSVLPKITAEKAKTLDRHRLKPEDILFARRGVQATGHIGFVRKQEEDFLCGTGAIRLRVNDIQSRKVLAEFLSHVFAAAASVAWFKVHAIGATMPNLNESIIRSFPLLLPPVEEQRAIADSLTALDDKIELNQRMSETLEAIAHAIFKSHFLQQAPHVGPIAKVGEVAEIIKGRSYKSEELVETADTALVTLKSFERGGGYKADGLKGFSGTFRPEQEVKPGEVVVALTDVTQNAEVIGRPALVRRSAKFSKLVASLDTAIVRARKIVGSHFLYCLFRTPEFADHTYAYCSGTTVLHLGKEAIPSFAFPEPEERDALRFEQLVTPMFDRITNNEIENTNLAAIRDALLPKLMSGEIRLRQTEKTVEAHG